MLQVYNRLNRLDEVTAQLLPDLLRLFSASLRAVALVAAADGKGSATKFTFPLSSHTRIFLRVSTKIGVFLPRVN